MGNRHSNSIISVTMALMIFIFTNGCSDPTPNVGAVSPPVQSSSSDAPPTIDDSDSSLPVSTIILPPDTDASLENNGLLVFGVRDGESNELTPILGTYHRHEDTLSFTPDFPVLPNTDYEAVNLLTEKATSYRWNKTSATTPTLAIHPQHKVLPANHLKFYLYFSEPMQQDTPWEHCKLLDLTTDQYVPRPFRHTELWNETGDRLTLWFHPGRQKTGVNLNVEIGPILTPEHDYELHISGNWSSLKGGSLSQDVTLRFRAGPADHDQPDPEAWNIHLPTADTSDPLVFQFNEPLDHAMLRTNPIRLSRLPDKSPSGSSLLVNFQVTSNNQSIRITPDVKWTAGEYELQINPRLEDLAGNSIERPFEVDLTQTNKTPSRPQSLLVTIPPKNGE